MNFKKIIPERFRKRIGRSIKVARYLGYKYECPFCGHKTNDFYPIGLDIPILSKKKVSGAGRRNGGCYKCHSGDRERLVYAYLVHKFNLYERPKDIRILHIAPEENISKKIIDNGFNNYICGDLFAEGYNYPDYVQNIDVLSIPFGDNHFDLIICNHVLEHIDRDTDAMGELYRVLKVKGKAILQVPLSKNSTRTFEDVKIKDPKEREVKFGQSDHVRLYGSDFGDRLESIGFSVQHSNLFQEFSKFGIAKDEDIYIASKLSYE